LLLRRLSLAYFRNYIRLDLPLNPGLTLFWGDNGEGKSNLLEAAYLLATTRSFRTSSERDLINWHADTEPIFARVAGEVLRGEHLTRLDVILSEAKDPSPPSERQDALPAAGKPPLASVRRRARINGHDRPLLELLGHLNAVLFSPEDVDLVSGPAERRRRYLDVILCQVDPRYVRNLRRFVRVLTQRNALLKLARERSVPADEFEYWDSQLTTTGAALLVARLLALESLNRHLIDLYPQLTSHASALRLEYRSTVPLDGLTLAVTAADVTPEARESTERDVAARYYAQLAALSVRERAQAVTLSGIHRDDAAFTVDGVDLRTYGSRGQQRIAALALRLAEAAFMYAVTGDRPVLLLDDLMSELDPARRIYLQRAVSGHEQVLLTATDVAPFEAGFLAGASRYSVAGGRVRQE